MESIQHFRLAAIGLFAFATVYLLTLEEYVSAAITMIAGFAYVAMYLREQNALAARYTDWSLTTPLILYIILSKANVPLPQIFFVMAADFLMILTGYFGRVEPEANKRLLWYWVGMILFIPVILTLSTALKSQKAAVLSLVIWLVYPLVWIAAEKGIFSRDTENKITAILDTTAKIGFGLFSHLE